MDSPSFWVSPRPLWPHCCPILNMGKDDYANSRNHPEVSNHGTLNLTPSHLPPASPHQGPAPSLRRLITPSKPNSADCPEGPNLNSRS